MDYIAAMNQNWGFCLAVEKLMAADEKKTFEVPERAEYLRVLICELNRIASHLLAFGTYGMDIGAFTPFLYASGTAKDSAYVREDLRCPINL